MQRNRPNSGHPQNTEGKITFILTGSGGPTADQCNRIVHRPCLFQNETRSSMMSVSDVRPKRSINDKLLFFFFFPLDPAFNSIVLKPRRVCARLGLDPVGGLIAKISARSVVTNPFVGAEPDSQPASFLDCWTAAQPLPGVGFLGRGGFAGRSSTHHTAQGHLHRSR